jgi:putative endonuclease
LVIPTKNIQQRFNAHHAGQGADYTKQRRPVTLVHSEPHVSKTDAMAREKQIKKGSKAKKRAWMDGNMGLNPT